MAAPAFRSGATAKTTANVTSLACNKPAGTAAGDVLLAFAFEQFATGTWNALAGWTKLDEGADGAGLCGASYYRVADGSEGATFTFTYSVSTTVGIALNIAAFTGCSLDAPIDAHAVLTPLSTNVFAAPTVTTVGADRLIVRDFEAAAQASSQAWTTASSHTEQIDANGSAIDTVTQTSPGASGTASATYGVSVNGIAFTVALAPPFLRSPIRVNTQAIVRASNW